MSENKWYAEDHELSAPWGWLIIVVFTAAIMGYGWLVYRVIPDAPRQWNFGQLPDTPAESIYSTEVPRISPRPPRQLLRLPETEQEKAQPSTSK